MISAIDETELARLEALAAKASTLPFEEMAADGWGYVVVDILPAVTTAVPALVAEVRRLRAENLHLQETVMVFAEQAGEGNLGKIQDELEWAESEARKRESVHADRE